MNHKEFIESCPLELCLPTKESEAFRVIVKKANESYILDCKEELGINIEGDQYYNFYVHCPTKSFANAYFHLSLLYAEHVLPIWEERHKTKTK